MSGLLAEGDAIDTPPNACTIRRRPACAAVFAHVEIEFVYNSIVSTNRYRKPYRNPTQIHRTFRNIPKL